MRKHRCSAFMLLIAVAAFAVPHSARADFKAEAASLITPADGAEVQANADPAHVMLAWKGDQTHERVRYFVEVVAIAADKLSEVFASYVDRPTVTVTLDSKPGDYAWRVYTVGVNDPDYVLSDWHRFSIQASQSSPGRWFLGGVLLVILSSCHRPPPPPAPIAAAPPPPVIQSPKPPAPVNASWSFSITQTACIARAVNREVSLTVNVGSDGKLEYVLSATALRSGAKRTGSRGRLRFHGSAGSLVWPARATAQRTLAGSLPANGTAANEVLIALGGGTLRTEFAHARVPVLRVPAANVAGRDWFECVRAKIDHASSSAAQG